MTHTSQFLQEVQEIARTLPEAKIESLVSELKALRDRGGRLFLVGLGGSAANCSHAVNDFRRLCGIDAQTPVDNSAELTAAANDEGWKYLFDGLKFTSEDAIMVLSVGGGTLEVSVPISYLMAKAAGTCRILGIVGRDGGETKKVGHQIVIIPTVSPERVTPHTEAFQMVLLHLLVSHPSLQLRPTKW